MNVSHRIVTAVVIAFVVLLAVCWRLSLQIHDIQHDQDVYEMGRRAERQRSPVYAYFEKGDPFYFDGADFHSIVKTGKKTFRIK